MNISRKSQIIIMRKHTFLLFPWHASR